MSQITGLTRGGDAWTPQFVTDLNQEKCIGCGRCYKVCPRNVLDLVEREIDEAMTHPSVDDLDIATLKRRKLALKDEIAKLKGHPTTH